jgi:uncharacterized membrane protein
MQFTVPALIGALIALKFDMTPLAIAVVACASYVGWWCMNALKISPKMAFGTKPTTIPMATPDSTLNALIGALIALKFDMTPLAIAVVACASYVGSGAAQFLNCAAPLPT